MYIHTYIHTNIYTYMHAYISIYRWEAKLTSTLGPGYEVAR